MPPRQLIRSSLHRYPHGYVGPALHNPSNLCEKQVWGIHGLATSTTSCYYCFILGALLVQSKLDAISFPQPENLS